MDLIPENIETLWEIWDLRCCILVSLFLQAFLVLFSSFRRKFKSAWLLFFIWSAYLLADWIAAVAIGLITQSQGSNCKADRNGNEDLLAFWASFLLLHLGGPDTITSFSLEDNEFWIRHLFSLLLQNKLWLPTFLVFIVGTIKYAERTYALYRASLDRFGATVLSKPDPGPDYEESAALYSIAATATVIPGNDLTDDAQLISELGEKVKDLEGVKLLQLAHLLFDTFKGLIVGLFLSNKDRETSRDIFLKIDYKCAFKLIEYELSFMYQALHTKAVVVHSKFGYILRFISLSSILGASIFFFLVGKKSFGAETEIALTFTLLVGAIVLDVISIINLIFSEWTLLDIPGKQNNWREKYITTRILKKKRWSEKVYQYNMIDYCLDTEGRINKILSKIAHFLHATAILEQLRNMRFSSSKPVKEPLKEFIFEELKDKSNDAGNLKEALEACSQRGDSALLKSSYTSYIKLKWSIGEFQYAESILLWHLATNLICYLPDSKSTGQNHRDGQPSDHTPNDDSGQNHGDGQPSDHNPKDDQPTSSQNPEHGQPSDHNPKDDQPTSSQNHEDQREKCKALSDYMFYLFVLQPTMMSPVLGNWYKVFQDTCAEAKRFFEKHNIKDYKGAWEKMEGVKTKVRPAAVKGTKSKSVFFDACILARQLRNMGAPERWRTSERMWLEFVTYAASSCKANIHAQQPSKGGELLTFIWLMMYHFGLGIQFSEQEELAGTKMVAVK
ncbi:hypothetical protein UlMin_007156 [Ulmus minor]